MSMLLYDVSIEEEQVDKNGNVINTYHTNLPHHSIIVKDFKESFEQADLLHAMPEKLQKKIQEITMTVFRSPDKRTIARIHVQMKKGVRINKDIRESVFDELNAQMSDGFGESMDMSQIPGAEGYQYAL